ncbi:helix-turn-helix domain-containing protein [Leuconostoc suionicum]|uniref:helix-turn-helix domain-containing protein n=1 Tax=Leuconostoc suionicum TaxID=1511761 RepID=UPI00233EE5B8|nr:helix-turn-helix domain-containing protein [Leuconostoc suionicum]MDC2805330.1 helix-turn-helix domain-containing protein [Leuconostoc suionicum]MDC2822842.1 helix-turn-helix domain-containing protein [Leuconostoc suionicum]
MKEFKSNIIKEKRKLRNMSQAQLGDIIGSQAMVSRIENGQILPNAQTIFILCNKLEITVEEYFYSVFGPDQNTTIFKNDLDKLYMQGNIDELRKIFSHYKHHKSLNIETKHRMLIVKSTIYHLFFQSADEIDQNILFSYFDQIINWRLYDIYLFESTINMLPVKKTKSYFLDILSQYNSESNVMCYPDIITSTIIKYLETSIMQKENNVTIFLLNKLEMKKISLNTNQQLWKLFLTGIYYNNEKKIKEAYNITEYLNDVNTTHLFDRMLSYYTKK